MAPCRSEGKLDNMADNSTTSDHYKRWSNPDCIELFANKKSDSFFKTETRFLSDILSSVESVIDIGCASGNLIELLSSEEGYGKKDLSYIGVDIVDEHIEKARGKYPQHEFILENALDFHPAQQVDLVNATGVIQNEPRFQELIPKMIAMSKVYVLFDLKIARIDNHLIDLERSYAGAEDRLYFILVSLPHLLSQLLAINRVEDIHIFGYETVPNRRTHIPEEISTLISAGVLLKLGDGRGLGTIKVELPRF